MEEWVTFLMYVDENKKQSWVSWKMDSMGRTDTHSSSKSTGRIPDPFWEAWERQKQSFAAMYNVPSHQLSFLTSAPSK